MDRDQRMHLLLLELDRLDVRLRLDRDQLRVQRGDRLTAELCDEVTELRAELVEYLRTQGEETVIDDAESRAHSDMHTPPRTPAEAEQQRADAERERERARRRYQGGAVLVNHPNNMRAFMRRLREQREDAEARERGGLPPQGRYVTRFDIFRRDEG